MRKSALWAAEATAAAAAAYAKKGPTFRDRIAEAGFARADLEDLEEVLEAEAQARAVSIAADFLRELRERLKTESAAVSTS